MDGHHLGVHREGSVCLGSAAAVVHFLECAHFLGRLLLLVLRLQLVLLALLQLGLHVHEGRAGESAACDTAMLESAAVEARAVVVVALANDLAAAHDDAAMAVVQRRFFSLLQAERQVIVRLHFAVDGGLLVGGVVVDSDGGGWNVIGKSRYILECGCRSVLGLCDC